MSTLLDHKKVKLVIPPTAIKDNADFVSTVIDLQTDAPTGFKGILFEISVGATDIAMATCKVMQSDTKTDATTLGGTPEEVHDMTTKPAADADNTVVGIWVPRGKITERYVQLQMKAGDGSAGTFASATAQFDTPGESGATATLAGFSTLESAA